MDALNIFFKHSSQGFATNYKITQHHRYGFCIDNKCYPYSVSSMRKIDYLTLKNKQNGKPYIDNSLWDGVP